MKPLRTLTLFMCILSPLGAQVAGPVTEPEDVPAPPVITVPESIAKPISAVAIRAGLLPENVSQADDATVAAIEDVVGGEVAPQPLADPGRMLPATPPPGAGVHGAPEPESLQLDFPENEAVVLEMPGGAAQRSTVSRDAETISVDFPDEEVRTIVRNVAELYDLNVVIPDTLVGSVSLKLRNVTWRQVFDVVLSPLGYTYVEEGNIIKVKSQQDLMQEPVDTRVFVINFANAGELNPVLTPLIDQAAGGRIQVDNRSNALIITERPSRMGRIIEIIERLDRPTEQVMIESKFVEVTNRDLFDLGVNWSSLRGYSVNGDWGRETVDRREESDSNSVNRNTTRTVSVPAVAPTDVTERVDAVSVIDTLVREDTAVLDIGTFNVLLSALESEDEIELISNPTVVTMNNTPAVIHIGDQYPIPRYRYNEEQGVFEVDGFDYKDIGISLEVLPQVNTAGFITLRIHPEISSETGTVTFGGADGAPIPIITRRTTESTVTIKSGYTLAIGGLMERTTSTTDTKVPVLGDIPILGRLFRHDSDSRDQRNLIIFITAKVLNADGSTYRDVFSQRRLFEMGIKNRELPGYTPTEEEEQLFDQLQTARDEIEQLRAEGRLKSQLMELQKREEKDKKKSDNTDRDFKSRAR